MIFLQKASLLLSLGNVCEQSTTGMMAFILGMCISKQAELLALLHSKHFIASPGRKESRFDVNVLLLKRRNGIPDLYSRPNFSTSMSSSSNG